MRSGVLFASKMDNLTRLRRKLSCNKGLKNLHYQCNSVTRKFNVSNIKIRRYNFS